MNTKKTIICDYYDTIWDKRDSQNVKDAIYSLNNFIEAGYKIIIWTAREGIELEEARSEFADWPIEVTNTLKKPQDLKMIIDNRAHRFISWRDAAFYLL